MAVPQFSGHLGYLVKQLIVAARKSFRSPTESSVSNYLDCAIARSRFAEGRCNASPNMLRRAPQWVDVQVRVTLGRCDLPRRYDRVRRLDRGRFQDRGNVGPIRRAGARLLKGARRGDERTRARRSVSGLIRQSHRSNSHSPVTRTAWAPPRGQEPLSTERSLAAGRVRMGSASARVATPFRFALHLSH